MEQKMNSIRGQWIAVVVSAVVVLVGIVVFVVSGGDDDSASVADEKRAELCALRDGTGEPLVDPESSSTREELSSKIRERAAALSAAAESNGGEVGSALDASAEAMNAVADAIEADTSGASLAEAIGKLAADERFVESSATLEKVLIEQCS